RVASEIKIVQVIAKFYGITDTLCDGLSYPFSGNQLTTSGIYNDSLTSVHGCDSIVTLNLVFVPNDGIRGDFEAQNPTCAELENGTLASSNVSGGSPPYSYFANGDPIGIDGLALNLPAGWHDYTIVDRFGCRFDTTVQLFAPPPFLVDLFPDYEINLGDSVTLFSTASDTVANYNWSPDGLLACDTGCAEVQLQPLRTGYFTLRATSDQGCVAEDSVYIVVNEIRKIFIPTAFTPNGDGLNDHFSIFGDVPSAKQVDQLAVYDRWGKLVFLRENFPLNAEEAGWDGTINGKPVPEGVYAYVARVRFLDEEVFVKSGSVTLLR
ncbi:MAG: gliding motility-associated C-terminal domain-containing protein, partial [Bacteroidota bacterium]